MTQKDQKPLIKVLICLALAGITFAAFAEVFHCSFITLDDRQYVVANPHVQHGLSWGSIKWAFQTFYADYWMPITWLSHMLDCQLYGLNPGGHHVTNLIFHIANTVLLFLLLQKLTAKLWPSAFVALLFGIHPMHVESVAWVAERKDVLSAFFFLLTLLAYARYAELSGARHDPPSSILYPRLRWMFYAVALFTFALGLMSKPMVITLPFVLLLLDFWPLQRVASKQGEEGRFSIFPVSRMGDSGAPLTPRRSLAKVVQYLIIEKLPFFLLVIVSSGITLLAAQSGGAVKPALEFSLADRLGHVPVSYVWYISKFFWPTNLSVFYVLRKGADSGLEIVSASLLLLVVTIFILARARKLPYLLFGWLWFLGMLVPVIGLVQAGDQACADRFAYLPYIGLFVIIAWGIPDLLASTRLWQLVALKHRTSGCCLSLSSSVLWGGAALVAIACFVRTIQEVGYWKDGITLCRRAIALDRENVYAWMSLGAEYSNRGNHDEAINCMTRATRADPKQGLAWHDLGKLLTQKGNYPAAESAYQAALEDTWFSGDKADIYNDRGDALASAGSFQQAIVAYQSSLNLNPNQPDTQTRLGQAFLQIQQPDRAASAFEAAVELQPNNADALISLGMISQSSGLVSEAVAQYTEALQTDPGSVTALNNLAWILATDSDAALRNGPEAVSLAERACQLTHYDRAFTIGTLAAAYAEAGRFDDAVATAQKAQDVSLAHGEKDLASRNAKLLQFYKAHRPFRDEAPEVQPKK